MRKEETNRTCLILAGTSSPTATRFSNKVKLTMLKNGGPRNLRWLIITYHNLSALQIGICSMFSCILIFLWYVLYFSFSFLLFSVFFFPFLFLLFLSFFSLYFLLFLFVFFFIFLFLQFTVNKLGRGPFPSRLPKKLLQWARCGKSMADWHLEACLAPLRTRWYDATRGASRAAYRNVPVHVLRATVEHERNDQDVHGPSEWPLLPPKLCMAVDGGGVR